MSFRLLRWRNRGDVIVLTMASVSGEATPPVLAIAIGNAAAIVTNFMVLLKDIKKKEEEWQ